MKPETNKVSNCCGDRLCVKNEDEGTMYYECFNCKNPCDGVLDCARCFPQHWKVENGETIPLCDKHYRQVDFTKSSQEQEKIEGIGVKYSKQQSEKLATIIGRLLLNCGNLYNDIDEDITKEVGKYIYKTYG